MNNWARNSVGKYAPMGATADDLPLAPPSGKKTIDSTTEVDVSAYATAQVVDANLTAANIKKDTTILGITGSYEGGGGHDSELFSVAAKLTFNVSGTGFDLTAFSTYWIGTLYAKTNGSTVEIEMNEGMYLPNAQTIYYMYVPIGDTPSGVIAFDQTAWSVTVTSGDAEVVTVENNTGLVVTGDAVISVVKL